MIVDEKRLHRVPFRLRLRHYSARRVDDEIIHLQAAHMAQRVQVELVDDVDGKSASETVSFGLDGVSYEIDLSDKNAKALRKAYETWIASARRVGGRRMGAATRVATDVDTAAVRAWASSNGFAISPRGRLSREIVEKYRAAGN